MKIYRIAQISDPYDANIIDDNSKSGEELLTKYDSRYPLASSYVSGLEVLNDIPNTSSISASFNKWEELEGIREVPINDFYLTGKTYSVEGSKYIRNLAEQIGINRKIKPLIVGIDGEGPYILEGLHRSEALFLLKVKSFPALVVIDMDK